MHKWCSHFSPSSSKKQNLKENSESILVIGCYACLRFSAISRPHHVLVYYLWIVEYYEYIFKGFYCFLFMCICESVWMHGMSSEHGRASVALHFFFWSGEAGCVWECDCVCAHTRMHVCFCIHIAVCVCTCVCADIHVCMYRSKCMSAYVYGQV